MVYVQLVSLRQLLFYILQILREQNELPPCLRISRTFVHYYTSVVFAFLRCLRVSFLTVLPVWPIHSIHFRILQAPVAWYDRHIPCPRFVLLSWCIGMNLRGNFACKPG